MKIISEIKKRHQLDMTGILDRVPIKNFPLFTISRNLIEVAKYIESMSKVDHDVSIIFDEE